MLKLLVFALKSRYLSLPAHTCILPAHLPPPLLPSSPPPLLPSSPPPLLPSSPLPLLPSSPPPLLPSSSPCSFLLPVIVDVITDLDLNWSGPRRQIYWRNLKRMHQKVVDPSHFMPSIFHSFSYSFWICGGGFFGFNFFPIDTDYSSLQTARHL